MQGSWIDQTGLIIDWTVLEHTNLLTWSTDSKNYFSVLKYIGRLIYQRILIWNTLVSYERTLCRIAKLLLATHAIALPSFIHGVSWTWELKKDGTDIFFRAHVQGSVLLNRCVLISPQSLSLQSLLESLSKDSTCLVYIFTLDQLDTSDIILVLNHATFPALALIIVEQGIKAETIRQKKYFQNHNDPVKQCEMDP